MFLSKKKFIFFIFLALISGAAIALPLLRNFPLLQKIQFKEVIQAAIKEVPRSVILTPKEGIDGDFVMEAKKENGIVLSWPVEVKVTQVRVYDLGDPVDFKDHKLVFFAADSSLASDLVKTLIIPLELERIAPFKQPQSGLRLPEPNVYLTSPYHVGDIVQGFYDNTIEKVNPIFTKGHRYLIQVMGIKEGRDQADEYFFTF